MAGTDPVPGLPETAVPAEVLERLPAAGLVLAAQSGRRFLVAVWGTVRPARVTVTAAGPTIGDWLGSGRHPGFIASGHVIVHRARVP